jgi:hypothetical protein
MAEKRVLAVAFLRANDLRTGFSAHQNDQAVIQFYRILELVSRSTASYRPSSHYYFIA